MNKYSTSVRRGQSVVQTATIAVYVLGAACQTLRTDRSEAKLATIPHHPRQQRHLTVPLVVLAAVCTEQLHVLSPVVPVLAAAAGTVAAVVRVLITTVLSTAVIN